MKIIAVDDELLAVRLLEDSIRQVCKNADLFVFNDVDDALLCAENNPIDVAVLDIEMPGMNGLQLAKRLKDINSKINIIFVTGYSEYMKEGIDLRMSGYLFKPVTPDAIKKELENLRNPISWDESKILRVETFGNFGVYVGEYPVKFDRRQAKEILAYLIDKRGTGVTYAELAAVIFEDGVYDRKTQKNLQVYITSLAKTLNEYGAKKVLIRNRKEIMIDKSQVDCDFYKFMDGDVRAINSYTGQYLNEYSWAEFTTGYLDRQVLYKK